ncbi:MAG: periplasmic heavy metal sensor [Pseudomonadota bacterium]
MSSASPVAPQPRRLWVRILLAVSLAFNLLVIGAVIGVAVKGGPLPGADTPRHMVDAAIGPLTRALTKQDRRAIGRQIRQAQGDDAWGRRAHRQSLRRMLALLQETPFDRDAFAAELEGSITGLKGRMSSASQALVAHLSDMSDSERAAYAARVKEAMTRK